MNGFLGSLKWYDGPIPGPPPKNPVMTISNTALAFKTCSHSVRRKCHLLLNLTKY